MRLQELHLLDSLRHDLTQVFQTFHHLEAAHVHGDRRSRDCRAAWLARAQELRAHRAQRVVEIHVSSTNQLGCREDVVLGATAGRSRRRACSERCDRKGDNENGTELQGQSLRMRGNRRHPSSLRSLMAMAPPALLYRAK